MLTYDFSKVTGTLYEYVYECIRRDITEGVLQPGEKLPSKRSFAKNNGISTITIENAYEQLISEGYVYAVPKVGYFVAVMNGIKTTKATATVKYPIRIPSKEKEYFVDLSSNKTNPEHFPFSVWAKLGREVISQKSAELLIPSMTGGIFALRKAIAEYLKSFRGMLVDPDQIIIGAGTEYLYGLLIQLIGNEGTYCIENPGYQKLPMIYAQYHVTCEYAQMDSFGVNVEDLRKTNAKVAHLSPTHHFPTGITMPASRRYEVLSWANESEERYIIEDDYDSEFRPSGKPISTLYSMDTCEKVIYMNTFSKSLTPTIRISYMVLPVHLANRFYEKLSFYSCTVSNFEQYTLAEFISRGYFEKHINRMRLYYGRQRKKLLECLSLSPLKGFVQIRENDSGLHFILEIKTTLKDKILVEELEKREIHLIPLSNYDFTKKQESEHLFIMNYSNIDMEDLRMAFGVIYEIITTQSAE